MRIFGSDRVKGLMERLKIPATVRISFGVYNTEADVDAVVAAIQLAVRMFS